MKPLIIILLLSLTACATAPQPINITVNCNGNTEDLRADIADAIEEVRRPWYERAADNLNRYMGAVVLMALPFIVF